MKNWNDFDVFEDIINEYMLPQGEGETMASQAVTAVNKLVYKWFNDGDVYDNTYGLEGWANDLSSYANWLDENMPSAVRHILHGIAFCYIEDDYSELLYDLCDVVLDPVELERMNKCPKIGSIYDCDGPYKFVEPEEDDNEWW